ncbi:metal-dependent transcriptional regulator [Acetivibrio clariflavus]|uniref:Mn-dependent transcriptional regulator n=1 Tax=Acetivibrio clariflavus (strain DSM 19732 / NBRC 101661 / EBR45) TaxID=720554 RepID=G8LU96_ACECE|nr:metal-dependent transcriptional regulator [Acetivibrio clariflavus]AEV69528.1 Mn-dependent transcriptional regulator [Acetivibrio clariflavus DSM 19732]
MKIQESAENYLETILILKKRNGYVRSIDIANELSFSKPSVSTAMKNFREQGYISVESNGSIVLTESGLAIAERVYERHLLLAKYLMALGVDEETAKEDACRIEHVISQKSFDKIKEHCQKVLNININE